MIAVRKLKLASFSAVTFLGLIALAGVAQAQSVKVGLILPMSGQGSELGDLVDKGVRLFMKANENSLQGVRVELIRRDSGGPNPEAAKRLAQELIVREKVDFLTGGIFTPNAAAIAPITGEAKIPFVIMNAATSSITTLSPYVVRVSFTLWQTSYPLGQWAARSGSKKAYTLVSDYGPGIDGEQAFSRSFKEGGGEIVGSVRVPLQNPDFVPFFQRAADAKPDAIYVFVPAGKQATSAMKAFNDLGLGKTGIKIMGSWELTTDEELATMGDVALGVISSGHYSAAGDRPANKAFLQAWQKEYGAKSLPSAMSVGGWDAMSAIFDAIRTQNGKPTPEGSLKALSNWSTKNSPRGEVAVDPETRDVVQDIRIRRVEKLANGELGNVEIETIKSVKDPWKIINNKK